MNNTFIAFLLTLSSSTRDALRLAGHNEQHVDCFLTDLLLQLGMLCALLVIFMIAGVVLMFLPKVSF